MEGTGDSDDVDGNGHGDCGNHVTIMMEDGGDVEGGYPRNQIIWRTLLPVQWTECICTCLLCCPVLWSFWAYLSHGPASLSPSEVYHTGYSYHDWHQNLWCGRPLICHMWQRICWARPWSLANLSMWCPHHQSWTPHWWCHHWCNPQSDVVKVVMVIMMVMADTNFWMTLKAAEKFIMPSALKVHKSECWRSVVSWSGW